MESLILKDRRKKVFDYMDDNSLFICFSGEMVASENGNDYDFEVNRDFYYLTNVDQEDCVLLFLKKDGKERQMLFIPQNNEHYIKWTGIKYTIPEVMALSDIEDVCYLDEFEDYVNDFSNDKTLSKVFFSLDENNPSENYNLNLRMFKEMYKVFDNLDFYNIRKCISALREVKNEYEISCIKKGAKNLKNGINMALRITKPGVKEAEIAATIDYVTLKRGDSLPFKTIVASGKNATTLHYIKCKDRVKDGDLVLLDCGSGVDKYSADVSRTYPVSGRFTPFQKKIYDIVLKANKEVIDMVKPGVTLTMLNDKVIDIYYEELKKLSYVEKREDVSEYYYHFVSHFIGLNCHDPFDKEKPLVEGNVLTVEPGLYIEKEGIGIRIEDNVLVTEDGCEIITK